MSSTTDQRSDRKLKSNTLGVAGILFFVFSGQAPLTGTAGAAPISFVIGNGLGVPLAYLASGVIILMFSIGFVTMGRYVVNAGAFYAYIGKGLGERTGIAGASLALLAYNAIQACMYGLYGAICQGIGNHYLGMDIAWYWWAFATMAIVWGLGVAGIEVGARVLAVLVAAEFSLLAIFAVVTLVKGGGPEGLAIAETFSWEAATAGAPGVALMFAIASMFGFEATAIYGEEAKNPRRTVPRATYLSVFILSGFFAFVTWMLIAFYGPSNAVDEATTAVVEEGDGAIFVFNAVGAQLGGWTGNVLEILLATSLFAGILAFHNSINRYLYSLGRDGVLPDILCTLNQRQSPSVAGAVQTAVVFCIVLPFMLRGMDPVLTLFSWLSGLAVLAMMVLYMLTCLAVVVFFRNNEHQSSVWATLIAPVLGAAGTALAVFLILNNFTTLIGGSAATAWSLVSVVPIMAVVGVVIAQVRRDSITADFLR